MKKYQGDSFTFNVQIFFLIFKSVPYFKKIFCFCVHVYYEDNQIDLFTDKYINFGYKNTANVQFFPTKNHFKTNL